MLGPMRAGTVVAMGGGGFSMEPDNPLLDDFVLSLVPGDSKPRVCFVPTAAGDSPEYIQRFEQAFGCGRAVTSVLSLFQREHADLRSFVLSQDVVYVGGGSTANLLALWRLHGLDQALLAAYQQGVILTGVSAGMNCWFKASVTDSFSVDQLHGLHDGLGLIGGSACPHYDGEAARRPTYLDLVGSGRLPEGYAADDGCALVFLDGHLAEAVSSRAGARAFWVSHHDDGARERALDVRYLGGSR